MKSFLREYYIYFIYAACGILLILSVYNIIINVKHANYLNEKVVVSDKDNTYNSFKDNILSI